MAPQDKKWDDAAERDLCMAIILGNQDDNRVRYNWPRVHTVMTDLGYYFTKDAISQHFTKTIMKDFKARHGDNPAKGSTSAASTPKKPRAAPSAVPKTPSSRKRTKVKTVDDILGPSGDEKDDVTPNKKPKIDMDDISPVKKENRPFQRERSMTVADNEEDYRRWIGE